MSDKGDISKIDKFMTYLDKRDLNKFEKKRKASTMSSGSSSRSNKNTSTITKSQAIKAAVASCVKSKNETLDLSGLNIKILPFTVVECKHIKRLMLRYNKLNNIPNWFWTAFTKLEYLDLGHNDLSELPKGFSQLYQLKFLNLCNNSIEFFPTPLLKMYTLMYINLSNNTLVNVPNDIDNIKNLEYFDVSSNLLMRIPQELCNISKLHYLHIDKNQFLHSELQTANEISKTLLDRYELLQRSNNESKAPKPVFTKFRNVGVLQTVIEKEEQLLNKKNGKMKSPRSFDGDSYFSDSDNAVTTPSSPIVELKKDHIIMDIKSFYLKKYELKEEYISAAIQTMDLTKAKRDITPVEGKEATKDDLDDVTSKTEDTSSGKDLQSREDTVDNECMNDELKAKLKLDLNATPKDKESDGSTTSKKITPRITPRKTPRSRRRTLARVNNFGKKELMEQLNTSPRKQFVSPREIKKSPLVQEVDIRDQPQVQQTTEETSKLNETGLSISIDKKPEENVQEVEDVEIVVESSDSDIESEDDGIDNDEDQPQIKINREEYERARSIIEIWKSEAKYCHFLNLLDKVYVKPISEGKSLEDANDHEFLPENVCKNMIPKDLNSIIKFSNNLSIQLENRIGKFFKEEEKDGEKSLDIDVFGLNRMKISDLFVKMAPFLKVYVSFVTSYTTCINTIRKCRKKYLKFDAWLDKKKRSDESAGHDIGSLLVMPVQRITRYVLLLQTLLKKTEDYHPDYEGLVEAVQLLSEQALYQENHITETNNRMRVNLIGKRLKIPNLVEPHRNFIQDGYLKLYNKKHTYKCYLFSDLLILHRVMNSKNLIVPKPKPKKFSLMNGSITGTGYDTISLTLENKKIIELQFDTREGLEKWETALALQFSKLKAVPNIIDVQRRRSINVGSESPTKRSRNFSLSRISGIFGFTGGKTPRRQSLRLSSPPIPHTRQSSGGNTFKSYHSSSSPSLTPRSSSLPPDSLNSIEPTDEEDSQ